MYKNNNFETSFNQTINLIKQQQQPNKIQNLSTITNMHFDNYKTKQYGSGLEDKFLNSKKELLIEATCNDNKLVINKFEIKDGIQGNYTISVTNDGNIYTFTQDVPPTVSTAPKAKVAPPSPPSSSPPAGAGAAPHKLPTSGVQKKVLSDSLVTISNEITLPQDKPFEKYMFPEQNYPQKEKGLCLRIKTWVRELDKIPSNYNEFEKGIEGLTKDPIHIMHKEDVLECLKRYGIIITESPYSFKVGTPILVQVPQSGGANELLKSRIIMVSIADKINVDLNHLQFFLHKLVEHNFTNAIICVCNISDFLPVLVPAPESIKFGYTDSNSITLDSNPISAANVFGQTYFHNKSVINVVALIKPEDSSIQMKYVSNKNTSGLVNLAKVLAISDPNRNYVDEGTLFDLLFFNRTHYASAINSFNIDGIAKYSAAHFVVVQNGNRLFVKKLDIMSGKLLGYTNVTTPDPTEAANNVVIDAEVSSFKLVNADDTTQATEVGLMLNPHNNMNNYGDNNGYRLIDMLFSK